MRKNKGITLVALVVTIVVTIIIAGISINLLLGENGILTKAKETKKAQKVAEVKEKLSLEIAAAETDAIIRNENLEQRQLEDIINKYGTLQEDGDTILTKEDNYELSLKEIWYGVLSTSGSYSNKVEQVEMLEKEVEDLKKKCEQLENLNQENSGLLEDLQKQIENLQKEKENLENELQEEKNKNQGLEQQLGNLNSTLGQTDATADKILKNYKAYSKGNLITGTMEDRGALNWNPTTSETKTIEPGYYRGGTISTANMKTLKNSQIVGIKVVEQNEINDTYTATNEGKLIVTLFNCRGNSGGYGDNYLKKNGTNLNVNKSAINSDCMREFCYIFDVAKNDKIQIYCKSTGDCNYKGYSITLIS